MKRKTKLSQLLPWAIVGVYITYFLSDSSIKTLILIFIFSLVITGFQFFCKTKKQFALLTVFLGSLIALKCGSLILVAIGDIKSPNSSVVSWILSTIVAGIAVLAYYAEPVFAEK